MIKKAIGVFKVGGVSGLLRSTHSRLRGLGQASNIFFNLLQWIFL